jgi:serine/threonine protein kinase
MYQLAFGSIAFEKDNPVESMHHLGSPTVALAFPEEDSRGKLIDLLRKLLIKHAASRSSSFEALRAHPFFAGVDWASIADPRHTPSPPTRLKDCLSNLFSTPPSGPAGELPEDLANVFLPGWLEAPFSS